MIDNGSGMVKAGFAGDHVPKHIFPNFVGRPKHVRVMAGALEGDVFLGKNPLYLLTCAVAPRPQGLNTTLLIKRAHSTEHV